MPRKGLLLVAILVTLTLAAPLQAQTTFHVFPQFADGAFSDGTFYRSTLNVTPWFSDTACSLNLQGLTADFGQGDISTLSISLTEDQFLSTRTTGVGDFEGGYATLTCSNSTFAEVTYSLFAANGSKISEATVFSSRESSVGRRLLVDGRDGARLGVAVANTTDLTRMYDLTLRDATGSTVSTGTMSVPAKTSLAKFVDELMTVPAGSISMLDIRPQDFSDFATIGLRFTGPVFTTVPAN